MSASPSMQSKVLIAASLLASLGSAVAQQAAAPVPTENQSSNTLEAIIVTAQKRDQRLQDVPVTITALTSADLPENGVVAARDLPSVVSGLVWSNQGAWIEPNIRGVLYTNVAAIGSGSPIAIYLDGVYQALAVRDHFRYTRHEPDRSSQGSSRYFVRTECRGWCDSDLHRGSFLHAHRQYQRKRRRLRGQQRSDRRALRSARLRERPPGRRYPGGGAVRLV